jgi:hypothetical protein
MSLGIDALLLSIIGDDIGLEQRVDGLVAVTTDQGFPFYRATGAIFRGRRGFRRTLELSAGAAAGLQARSRTRGTMTRPRVDHRTAPHFGQHLDALAAQLLHARSDGRKVVSGTGSGALAAQLLHASADHRKIVSGAGAGHVSSIFL